jgi:hypothetical protein
MRWARQFDFLPSPSDDPRERMSRASLVALLSVLAGCPRAPSDGSEAPPEIANLKALLRRGVTTVLDLGNRRAAMVDLRERLRSGRLRRGSGDASGQAALAPGEDGAWRS